MINPSALAEVSSSAGTLHLVLPVHSRSLSDAENDEPLMREMRSACFFLSPPASETVPGLVKMSLAWLRELLGQERALQGRHAVPKPEVGEAIEIKDENEEALVYWDTRPVNRSRRE